MINGYYYYYCFLGNCDYLTINNSTIKMSRITIAGDPTVHEYINRNAETDNMHPAILRSEIEARPLRPRTYVPNSLPLTNTAGNFYIVFTI